MHERREILRVAHTKQSAVESRTPFQSLQRLQWSIGRNDKRVARLERELGSAKDAAVAAQLAVGEAQAAFDGAAAEGRKLSDQASLLRKQVASDLAVCPHSLKVMVPPEILLRPKNKSTVGGHGGACRKHGVRFS